MSNKLASLEKETRDRWTARIADTGTPWTPGDMKHFCRIAQARSFEPIVRAWIESAYEIGPYLLDGGWSEGKERWLRARHVRLDGGARLGSPFGEHLTELLNRALLNPTWRLLGFYDAGTVLRDAYYPVVFLANRNTMEGVAFVHDGDLSILTSWRESLATGRPNWRG